MLLKGLPVRWPEKTNSPNLGSALRIAITNGDNGTL